MNKDELEFRIRMNDYCIEVLEKYCADDPRQPEALEHYKKKGEILRSRLPKPPDIVIGLKPGILAAQSPKLGE